MGGLVRTFRIAAAVLVACLSAALVLGCGGDSDSDSSSSDGTSFDSSDGGYAVELPDGWTTGTEEQQQDVRDVADPAIDDLGVDASAVTTTDIFYRDGEDSSVQTNVNVLTEQLPDGVSFDDGVQAGVDLIEQSIPGAVIQSGPDPTTLDGEDAFNVRYTATIQDTDLQFALVQALHDGLVYSITLTTTADDFDEAEAEFQQIIDSWHWT